MRPDPRRPFRWRDGERVIVYGAGALERAGDLLQEPFALLSTARALPGPGELAARASSVHEVRAGPVDEIAGELTGRIDVELIVALGGGRVIDTAKALVAAGCARRAAAIPTTLSGAEMTAIHRHAAGIPAETPRVRPAIVIADPALSATQPLPQLADSAANALAHAVEGPLTPLRNPVSELAALAAGGLLAEGLADPASPAREALALGSLLAGLVIDATGYGLHHVLSQTLVRLAGLAHGRANAVMLPHTIGALRRRDPEWLASMDATVGGPVEALAARLRDLGGGAALSACGVGADALERCAEAAAGRPELAMTPPRAEREEIRALYAAAG